MSAITASELLGGVQCTTIVAATAASLGWRVAIANVSDFKAVSGLEVVEMTAAVLPSGLTGRFPAGYSPWRFCPPYDSALNLLREEYRQAVARLAAQSPDRQHPMLAWQRLAEHLMVYYLRGRLGLEDELLQEFFNTAPVELRSVALRFVGHSSYTIEDRAPRPLDPPATGEPVDRAIGLWEARIATAEAAEDRSAFAPEMAEFGWWFVSPVFDPEWALIQILRALRIAGSVDPGHLVGQRLAELVSAYCEQVVEVLDLMMKGQNDDWLVLGEEPVTEILRAALSGPEEVGEKAEQITHGLGARGYRQFRSLLQPG